MIKKYNLAKPEKYTAKDGSEKTIWHNIGTITEFTKDDRKTSRILEIPAIGLKANIFQVENKNKTAEKNAEKEYQGYSDKKEEIGAEEIPF